MSAIQAPRQAAARYSGRQPPGALGREVSASRVQALQRSLGNRAVVQLLRAKLSVSEQLQRAPAAQRVQQWTRDLSIQRISHEDCSEADRRAIREAYFRAIAMLQRAINRLNASPVSATTQRHFANHFGAYAEWRRGIVVMHLERDLSLLNEGDITFECETDCDSDDRAYTYWIFGDIHLCPSWLSDANVTERAETLIHELHHWDPARGHLDLGYHGNQRDVDTVWIVAVNNADSYSELVQDLYEGT